jgi:integrase
MQTVKTESKNALIWESVETNLIRYKPTGGYYVKAKLHGRKVRESLDTDNLISARRLLSAWMAKARGRVGKTGGKTSATMGGLIEEYKAWLSNRVQAPRTTEFRLECLGDIVKTWPRFELLKVNNVSRHDVTTWRDSLVSKHDLSHSRANGMLGTVRQMFELAEGRGLLLHDPPTMRIKGLPVQPKKMRLPSKAAFEKLRERIYAGSPEGGELFDFLQLSGCRIDSAKHAHWGDVDWEKGELCFVKAKRGSYTIPLFKSLREFLEKLKPANAKPTQRITKVDSIKKVMGNSCASLARNGIAIQHLSHHDLRHWFATRCIELAVDIPTLSRWLGHKDGGALAMRVYGHLRNEHSQAMAQKI